MQFFIFLATNNDYKLNLEKPISSLVDYFSYHSLKLNSEKTESIVFGTSSAAESIKEDNHTIQRSLESEISRIDFGQKTVVPPTR